MNKINWTYFIQLIEQMIVQLLEQELVQVIGQFFLNNSLTITVATRPTLRSYRPIYIIKQTTIFQGLLMRGCVPNVVVRSVAIYLELEGWN